MKKTSIIIFIISLLFLFPGVVRAQSENWAIENLNSEINVLQSGKVSVKEDITADFKQVSHHGIFRDLIFKKDSIDGKKHYISYEITSVTMDGATEQYTTSYTSDFFEIKIGDPNITLTGQHDYIINYTATGALGSFADHDELFWNATGNYWSVPILSAKATVSLAAGGLGQTTCYQGIQGSTSVCENQKTSQSSAVFSSTKELSPGEGLTLVVGFSKGLFPILEGKAPPSFDFQFLDAVVFCLFFFGSFIIMFSLWWKKGRDHWFKQRFINDPNTRDEIKPIGGHDTIVVEFDPPEKLRPGEMGMILTEDFREGAMTATIVDLAARGYLQIKEEEKGLILKSKEYTFIKQNKNWDSLLDYEKSLLGGIFETIEIVPLSSLKKSLYKSVADARSKLNQEMVDKQYFTANPLKVKSKYFVIGALLIFIPVFLLNANFNLQFGGLVFTQGGFLVGSISAGIIVCFFGYLMSARTALGHQLKDRILGYKLFISTAEKYRQQFFERQNMFNEILPYAILFGQTEKFAKAFADLGVPPPQTNWYVGAAAFNAATFSNNMSAFASSFNSSMSSSSGFSGGGAGGGGGGGGGGGW